VGEGLGGWGVGEGGGNWSTHSTLRAWAANVPESSRAAYRPPLPSGALATWVCVWGGGAMIGWKHRGQGEWGIQGLGWGVGSGWVGSRGGRRDAAHAALQGPEQPVCLSPPGLRTGPHCHQAPWPPGGF
jgi:hypothetical protein